MKLRHYFIVQSGLFVKWITVSLLTLLASITSASTINVNTFVDENGANTNACSFREAIVATTNKSAFGGCPAGEKYATDVIQLQSGVYQLENSGAASAFIIGTDVIIQGTTTQNWSIYDVVGGLKPGRQAISTIIKVPQNQRLFDTSSSRASLKLYNLSIDGGTAAYGGAIYAGGEITMDSVIIQNAYASIAGGAVYLNGAKSWMNAKHSIFFGNSSPLGDVLAMSCLDSLNLTPRTLTLNKVSAIKNGTPNSLATFDFCGEPTANFASATIATNTLQNTVNAAAVRLSNQNDHSLSNNSQLSFNGVTLVENTSGLYVNLPFAVTLANSILAFNNGKDCTYEGYPSTKVGLTGNYIGGHQLDYSASTTTGFSSTCSLPQNAQINNQNSIAGTYAEAEALSDVLWPLSDYNGFTYGYLPKLASKLINNGTVISACEKTDQREVYRPTDTETTSTAKCDVGALEYGVLTVTNDSKDATNTNYSALNSDISSMVSNTSLTDAQKQLLTVYQGESANFTYRTAFIDVLANDTGPEILNESLAYWRGLDNQPASTFPVIGIDNGYAISAIPLGTFSSTASTPVAADSATAGNIACDWIPSIRELRIYRKDGTVTPSGSVDVCQYSIGYGNNSTQTGLAYSAAVNVAPIAADDSLSLEYGAQTTAAFDLLANDTDNGDGPVGTALYAANSGFWSDPSLPPDRQVNIKIITAPTQGTLQFERSAPCPDNSASTDPQTCYGGKVIFINKNTYSPFNDQFTYQVLDKNRQVSNTATVNVKNTGAGANNSASAGGMATWFLGAIGVLGIGRVYYRIRNNKIKSSKS